MEGKIKKRTFKQITVIVLIFWFSYIPVMPGIDMPAAVAWFPGTENTSPQRQNQIRNIFYRWGIRGIK